MTAQGIEAATADKTRSGLAEGESPVRQDAPNSLYQEGYSMVDATEQQAVTVAQLQKVQDWLREPDDAEIFGTPEILEWINRRPTHIIPSALGKLALSRLASVSSASAEIPAGMKPWAGGDAAPDDWDHGEVWLRCGSRARPGDGNNTLVWAHPHMSAGTKTELGGDIVAYTPARVINLPEPVPATNQAGEVLEEITEDDLRAAIRKSIDHPGMTQNLFARSTGISSGHLSEFLNGKRRAEPAIAGPCGYRWALVHDTRATDDLLAPSAALATQPATSQEGEAREGCIGTMDAARATYFLERFKREEKLLGPHEQWALDFTIAALAATPTPPTLSEDTKDARAALFHLEAFAEGEDVKRLCLVIGALTRLSNIEDAAQRVLDDIDDCRSANRSVADLRAALARAQVKPS